MAEKTTYVVQTGGMSCGCTATTPGQAFRYMLRYFAVNIVDCGILVRFHYKKKNGDWSRWFYQDPRALLKEK